VPSPTTFLAWAESLESLDYYDVLRVARDATPAEIQLAFHEASLRCHPDRFVDEGPETSEAAAAVFKRVGEAYNVLRRPQLRARYDAELDRGRPGGGGARAGAGAEPPRFDEHAAQEKKTFEQRTLYMIARDPKAKQHAAQADRLLSLGKLEDARIQLITACQHDPSNVELKERLDILYEALTLEPP